MTQLERTALHEAGHIVVAAVLGRAVEGATVTPGAVLAGCARYAAPGPIPAAELDGLDPESPFICWPGTVQRQIEGEVMIALAGDIAAQLLSGPAEGRVPDPDDWVVGDLADFQLASAGEEDQAWAAAVVDDPPCPPDSQAVTRAAFLAFGRDPAQAAAWTAWLACQVRALVLEHERAIRRVAAALAGHGTLGGEALTRLMRGGVFMVVSA